MRGAVAAGHPLSAGAGARALAAGGNAVDACVAAAFAAAVAEGPLTGPAGGGFLLVHGAGGETVLLDCFFAVPRGRLGRMEEVVVDFADASTQSFHVGEGSVAVPGLVAGLEAAHRRFGSLPWERLLEPAVELAREGVVRNEAQSFLHEILAAILLRSEAGTRVHGDPERVVTAELADTLALVRDEGATAVASLLPELADDLAAYRVEEREPLRAEVLGREVLATPPPSRGGALVLDALGVLAAAGGGPATLARLARAIGDAYARSRLAAGRGTTHISVVDAHGTAAALSSTLGSGSGVFRGGTQLNNMLGELDVIGLDERPPGARLPSMMTPTLVLEDGRPRLVLGSAGSVRLAGAIAQVAWRVLAGQPVEEAIEAPRVHVEGGAAHVEGGWDDGEAEALEGEVVRWAGRNLYFGGVQAVELRADGGLAAAGDPRRGGAGVVVG